MRPAMRFVFAARRAFQTPADCQQWRGRVKVMERGERQRVDVLLVTAAVAAQPNPLFPSRTLTGYRTKALGDRSPDYLEAASRPSPY